MIVSVDRLDYTKGIPERLRAYRRLLNTYPDLLGKTVLVQVAIPSREQIPMYEETREEVDKLVGQINGEFSTPDWSPLVYIRRGISPSELVALYAAADVAWVSPLRDGLNLVAKEFVACQQNNSGVLVLSEFAGAAAEMGEAFLVNPYDEERTAETVYRALTLPTEERRERITALYQRVIRNDVFAWSERFLKNLHQFVAERAEHASDKPVKLPIDNVVEAYREASHRLLLLDYDGTLVGYANRPQDAVPAADLIELLTHLSADQSNTVAVVSGRRRADLEKWFGSVPHLWLAAEHGAVLRSPESSTWDGEQHGLAGDTSDWKERIRVVLEDFSDRTPGSLIEEKEFSLVWHYRMADPGFSEWLANELVTNLEQMLADTELRAVRGNKIVEVKSVRANKGKIITQLATVNPLPAFLLAAGDDRTDEDLFTSLPESAWTIHIGDGSSQARHYLPNPLELRKLLWSLIEAMRSETAATS